MKTVVVILRFKSQGHSDWRAVTENSLFGEDHPHYKTANDFINAVKDMHRMHSHSYEIDQIVIG